MSVVDTSLIGRKGSCHESYASGACYRTIDGKCEVLAVFVAHDQLKMLVLMDGGCREEILAINFTPDKEEA